ncbi:MAG: DUF1993 family protein [Roseivivax sp.]|nr:DUF1993 family protein [Roseivivax sp.]
MTAPALYTASVPVFQHYLARAQALVRLSQGDPEMLNARLAPDMFTAAQQFATAAGFALRGALPLVGAEIPAFPDLGMDRDGLLARFAFVLGHLDGLNPADFDGADTRPVSHRAGFAELTQPCAEYLHLFALPNFFFHLGMGFAVLRQRGLTIGKADFDGLHDYPPGFRF